MGAYRGILQSLVCDHQHAAGRISGDAQHSLCGLPASALEQENQAQQPPQGEDEQQLADKQPADIAKHPVKPDADEDDCEHRQRQRYSDQVGMKPSLSPPFHSAV